MISINKLGKLIRKRLRMDYDLVLAITGEEGSGKSTLALHLGKVIDKRFNMEKSMAFLPDEKEIVSEFGAIKKYGVYIIDEAIQALHKYKWMSQLQQIIVRMYATERWQNKCFGEDTPILMFDGSIKKVQDIKTNDLVMGIDSKPRKVLKTAFGFGRLYKIIPYKGESFIINENHILSLKHYNHSKIRIDNISVKDYLKKSKDYKTKSMLYRVKINFPHKEIPIDPYFLGLWLGDGISSLEGTRIVNNDSEILEFLDNFAKKNDLTFRQHSHREKGKCQTYGISGIKGKKNLLTEKMRKLNLHNNKHIPKIYKTNDKKIRLQVLAGLLDTDGCLTFNHYIIPTVFKKLKDDILYLARSLGFSAHSKKTLATNQTNKKYPYYRITIGGDVWRIPLRIKRKIILKKRQVNYKRDVLKSSIKKVQDVGKGKYYGFQVNKDGLHCLGDFTVTHNCTILCIPRFIDLTENFRNHRVKVWIHIFTRGEAVVYFKDTDPHTGDPWHIKDSLKRKDWFLRKYKVVDRKISQQIAIEKRMPTYYGVLNFPDMSEETKEQYISMKIKSREKKKLIEQVTPSRVGKREQRYVDTSKRLAMLLFNEGKTRTEIARNTGFDIKTICNWITELSKDSKLNNNTKQNQNKIDLLGGFDKEPKVKEEK